MKYTLTFLCITLLLTASHAQTGKAAQVPMNAKGHPDFWYTWTQALCDSVHLPHLIEETCSVYFRFLKPGQIIDVWTTDGIVFQGITTSHTKTRSSDLQGEKSPSRTLFAQTPLDTALARKIFRLSQTVANLPTGDSIAGWSDGYDGVTYLFETSTPDTYTLRAYWTPSIQPDTLIAAKQIKAFVDSIRALPELNAAHGAFWNTLAPGTYQGDGCITTIQSQQQLKRNEKARFKKARLRQAYFASVQDTLNALLSNRLTELIPDRHTLTYTRYVLTFARHHRLVRIRAQAGPTCLEEWKILFQCKRKIRASVKKIDLNTYKMAIKYQVFLMVENDKISILPFSTLGLLPLH